MARGHSIMGHPRHRQLQAALIPLVGLLLAIPAKAQLVTFHGTDLKSNAPSMLNNNFTWLNTNKASATHNHDGVYAPLAHVHLISDITGLQTALDGKAAVGEGGGGGNPESCTVNVGTSICITAAPYYASTAGATTTTTTGTFSVGTSGTVGSCTSFSANQGVSIAGAGAAGARYIGTVQDCSGTTLTITPATSTSVGTGTLVQHDETAAFQDAINALTSTGGKIYVPTGVYLVNGPPQDTGGANAVLKVPTIAANVGVTVIPITIQGFAPASIHYAHTGGSVIRTSQNTANFLGGYAATGYYGGFTSISLQLNNLYFDSTQANPGVTMINAAHILSLQADQVSITSAASATPSNAAGVGLRMPQDANNVRQSLDHMVIIGYYTLAVIGEHVNVGHMLGTTGHNCFVFEGSDHGNSTTVAYLWHQLCDNFIVGGSSAIQVNILAADSEVALTTMVSDPSNYLSGYINWLVPYDDARSPSTTTAPVIVGATGVRFNSLAFPDLVLSRPKFNPLNTGSLDYVGISTTATAGHAAVFAANGKDIVDGGSLGSLSGAVVTSNVAKPTCNSSATVTVNGVTVPVRSAIWFTQGGAGVADVLEVCMKDAADAYAWVVK